MEPEPNESIFEEEQEEEEDDSTSSSEIDSSLLDIELPCTTFPKRIKEERELNELLEKQEQRRINDEFAVIYDFILWTVQKIYGISRITDKVKEIEEMSNECFLCKIEVDNMQYFRVINPRIEDTKVEEMLRNIQEAKQRKIYLRDREKENDFYNIQKHGYNEAKFIELYYKIIENILILIMIFKTNEGKRVIYLSFALIRGVKFNNGYIIK